MEKALAIAFFWFGLGAVGSLFWIARASQNREEPSPIVWALAMFGPANLAAAFVKWLFRW